MKPHKIELECHFPGFMNMERTSLQWRQGLFLPGFSVRVSTHKQCITVTSVISVAGRDRFALKKCMASV